MGNRLLAALDREGRRVITVPQDWSTVEEAIGGDRQAAKGVLTRLKANGWLRNVRRGTYVIVDRSATARQGALELVGHVSEQPYFVTAGRALAQAGLSDQAFKRIVVVSPHEQRPWTWRGERVTYALLPDERVWGAREQTVGSTAVWIATPARAILDSLAYPRWGVSLSQVTEAIDRGQARDPSFVASLAKAARRYGQVALSRRLGFLVELVAGEMAAAPFAALVGNDRKPTLLQRGGLETGDLDRTWRIRVNVPPGLLLDHRHGG
jgi:predicted transcriptional regulator of viral defense system